MIFSVKFSPRAGYASIGSWEKRDFKRTVHTRPVSHGHVMDFDYFAVIFTATNFSTRTFV